MSMHRLLTTHTVVKVIKNTTNNNKHYFNNVLRSYNTPAFYLITDSKKEMVNEALVNMVIKDSQPFSIVDDDGFRELLHVLDPTYVIPTRKVCD